MNSYQQPRTAENKVIFQTDSCFSDSSERIIVLQDLDQHDSAEIEEELNHDTSPLDSDHECSTPSPREEIQETESSFNLKTFNNYACDVTNIDSSVSENLSVSNLENVNNYYNDVIIIDEGDCDSPIDQSITVELPSQTYSKMTSESSSESSPEPDPEPEQDPDECSSPEPVRKLFFMYLSNSNL